MRPGVRIRGVRIDDVTMDETIAAIAAMLERGGNEHIVTVNPEFVMIAQENAAFREALAAAGLAVADGAGIMVAARWQGRPLRERVTGVALTERLAHESARRGWRLFLLGAGPGVAERAKAELERRAPGARIVGVYGGSPKPEDLGGIVAALRAAEPEILLVAYGSPIQEIWIRQHLAALAVPVSIGVGGTFDYMAGVVPHAPKIVRRLGLEWLHRLVTQPWRWRRIYNAVVRFSWSAWREAKGHR